MARYATHVGLTYTQVRVWFKERRRKGRRAIGAHTERQLSSTSSGPTNASSSSNQAPVSEGSSVSIGEEPAAHRQVLFPKDYILRKVFRKDGPPLGSEFDTLPSQSVRGNIRGMPLLFKSFRLHQYVAGSTNHSSIVLELSTVAVVAFLWNLSTVSDQFATHI
jgi:hypothetical protein